MQFAIVFLPLVALVSVVSASPVAIAPVTGTGMPLPLRLAANSASARLRHAAADPYALPWAVADRW